MKKYLLLLAVTLICGLAVAQNKKKTAAVPNNWLIPETKLEILKKELVTEIDGMKALDRKSVV